MNRALRTISITAIALLARLSAAAQDAAAQSPDMASELRRSGKIYVVVLVLATIFAGIIAFLIYLERRVKRVEEEVLRQQKREEGEAHDN